VKTLDVLGKTRQPRVFPLLYLLIVPVFAYRLLQVPCTPQVTACNNPVVPTPNPAGYWNYSEVGGALAFGPEDLPTTPRQQMAWKGLQSYTKQEYCSSNGTTVFALKVATHICSYLCKVIFKDLLQQHTAALLVF
jgi:hypothetical protein